MAGRSRVLMAGCLLGLAVALTPTFACTLLVSTDGFAEPKTKTGVPKNDSPLSDESPLSDGGGGRGGGGTGSGGDARADGPLPPVPSVDASYATSCADILRANPATASGDFTIGAGTSARTVHCEMALAGGGWTRAVDFDAMRDGCPTAWTLAAEPGGCARTTDGVDSATFPAPLAAYSEVLVAAVGRQRATPDAFHDADIDSAYVDGVSITTRIDSKRVHVFSYAVGLTDDLTVEIANHCPCDQGARPPPVFVGGNFLCDSAVATGYPDPIWQATEDLWDQDGRGPDCSAASAPGRRFTAVKLPNPSRDPLEVRLMADQARSNEDIALKRLVLYVR